MKKIFMFVLICVIFIFAGCSVSPKRDLKDMEIINISPETKSSYATIFIKDKNNNILEYKIKIYNNQTFFYNHNDVILGWQISDKIRELLEKEYKAGK